MLILVPIFMRNVSELFAKKFLVPKLIAILPSYSLQKGAPVLEELFCCFVVLTFD